MCVWRIGQNTFFLKSQLCVTTSCFQTFFRSIFFCRVWLPDTEKFGCQQGRSNVYMEFRVIHILWNKQIERFKCMQNAKAKIEREVETKFSVSICHQPLKGKYFVRMIFTYVYVNVFQIYSNFPGQVDVTTSTCPKYFGQVVLDKVDFTNSHTFWSGFDIVDFTEIYLFSTMFHTF